MEKNLVGNSVAYVIKKILKEEVEPQDISKIYMSMDYTEPKISEYLRLYRDYWEEVVNFKAEKEVCKKYGVKSLWDIKGKQKQRSALEEMWERQDELKPVIKDEVKDLFNYLLDNNKIVSIKYKIPEGQKIVKVRATPSQRQKYGKEEYEVSVEKAEIVCINGELYDDPKDDSALDYGEVNLFYNEIYLLSSQLISKDEDGKISKDREFFLEKRFPQYQNAIKTICDKINEKNIDLFDEYDVLDLFNEILGINDEN